MSAAPIPQSRKEWTLLGRPLWGQQLRKEISDRLQAPEWLSLVYVPACSDISSLRNLEADALAPIVTLVPTQAADFAHWPRQKRGPRAEAGWESTGTF